MATKKISFTEDLRKKVKLKMGYCLECERPSEHSMRDLADDLMVSHTTIWRFLAGKNPSAELIDKLAEWLK